MNNRFLGIGVMLILAIGIVTAVEQTSSNQEVAIVDIPSGYPVLGNAQAPIGYNYTGDYIVAQTWIKKGYMPTSRAFSAAATVNGKIYVIGGSNSSGNSLKTNEEYNPATNTWTEKADMPTSRVAAGAATVNGKIYVIGGNEFGGGPSLKTNEEYDPKTDTWTEKADMPTARTYLSVIAVNGKIYAIGGWDGISLNTTEEYDPVNNTWKTDADMHTGRHGMGIAAVKGKIYAVGGVPAGGGGWTALKTNEEFNPATNEWTTKKDIITGVNLPASSALNNRVYIIGGGSSEGVYVKNNQEYNPDTNTWVNRTDIPTATYGSTGSTAIGVIYVIGGWNGSYLGTNYEYKVYIRDGTN